MPYIFSCRCICKTLAGFGFWCGLFLLPSAVQSATSHSITIQWDSNSKIDLAGYKVYQGTNKGIYALGIDVGKVTTYTAQNIQDGVTYYFAVTAYDLHGNESSPSAEVNQTFLSHTTTFETP